MSLVLFPRFHLQEIEDTDWCPNWLRDHAHSSLARLWQVKSSKGNTLASQACEILLFQLGGVDAAADYTFIDACAGAGGPTPYFEKNINKQLRASDNPPVEFVLTDWAPYVKAWQALAKQSPNITYIERPIDATKAQKVAAPGKKECRIFNLCFHHFDDPAAEQVLRSAIESTDAFFIFEITHRTLPSILYTVTASALGALTTTWFEYRWSPFHLILTYLIPLFPLYYIWDGFVSCVRGRTPQETSNLLLRQKGLDLSGWDFHSGEQKAPMNGTLFWYCGVKQQQQVKFQS